MLILTNHFDEQNLKTTTYFSHFEGNIIFKRKGQQRCCIRKSIQDEWGAVITY